MEVEQQERLGVPRRADAADSSGTWQPELRTTLALFAAFTVIWAAYSTITEAPVAIKHDMAEAFAWGREFQLGYNQHPPFWAWICGLWFLLLPRTGWAFALLSSVNAAIGLVGAWRLIGDFATGSKRIAAWALLLLTPLYTFYAYKYDANIIFLSIWPWALHGFMRSVQSRRIGDAIAFGALIGIALMAKYYALILVATCLLAALPHPAGRRWLASASPWIAAAVAASICAPHAWWLFTHDAPPLHYLARISDQTWPRVLAHVGNTVLGVVGMNLGVVIVVALVGWFARRDGIAASGREIHGPLLRVLATLALAPLGLTIAAALALRNTITPEMTVGIFPLLPLLIIELAGVRDIDRLRRIVVRLAVAVTLGALALAPVMALARTWWSPVAMQVAPFQEVAIAATRLWREQTGLPLAYVAGTEWYENATSFYSPDRPHAFAHFDYASNLWVTPDALARGGLLSLCVEGDQFCLAATARFATPETSRSELTLAHAFWGHVASPVRFVVTIIPPRR